MDPLPDRLRLFVGIRLSSQVTEQLAHAQTLLRHARIHMRWTRPENIHLTLLFLGETGREQAEELVRALRDNPSWGEPFAVTFAGIGAFPSLAEARVVWVGTREGREHLIALHQAVRQVVTRAGCRFDRKPFSPHLTIGRLGNRGGQKINLPPRLRAFDAGVMRIERFALIRSELLPGGSRYTDLCTVDLSDAA